MVLLQKQVQANPTKRTKREEDESDERRAEEDLDRTLTKRGGKVRVYNSWLKRWSNSQRHRRRTHRRSRVALAVAPLLARCFLLPVKQSGMSKTGADEVSAPRTIADGFDMMKV